MLLGINGYQGYSGGGFAGPGAAAGTAAGFGAAAPQVRKEFEKCFLSLENINKSGFWDPDYFGLLHSDPYQGR